jgi:hypothetical protein
VPSSLDTENGDTGKDIEAELETQKKEQDAMAKQQQEERPLAQKQRELGASSQQAVLVDDDKVLYEKLEVSKSKNTGGSVVTY